MKRVPVSAGLRDEFFAAALRERDSVAREVTSPELLTEVLGMLADYRAEQAPRRTR
jgi:hypothetical protein